MKNKAIIAIGIVTLIWIIFLIDVILPVDLIKFGILPRTFRGLFGIIFAPFLHADIIHLISNTLPLFFLSFALLIFYENIAIQVWSFIAFAGGLMVWIFGRSSYHIGASGIILGLIGFLIAAGIFRKSLKAIIISLIVFVFYGGALWGIFPTNSFVSWEGHLFGLISGIGIAWIYRKQEIGKLKIF